MGRDVGRKVAVPMSLVFPSSPPDCKHHDVMTIFSLLGTQGRSEPIISTQ